MDDIDEEDQGENSTTLSSTENRHGSSSPATTKPIELPDIDQTPFTENFVEEDEFKELLEDLDIENIEIKNAQFNQAAEPATEAANSGNKIVTSEMNDAFAVVDIEQLLED